MTATVRQVLKRVVGLLGLAAWRRVSSWRRDMATARVVTGRLATANDRLLPNAIILGAQKAGTTTLFALLARHPYVLTSCTKEVHFFDLQPDRGIEWYRAHFPLVHQAEQLASAGIWPAVLEASPYYLFHPAVPNRLAKVTPRIRFIVLLRNPVMRAWSHYWHERARGYEWRSPEAAFQRERDRLAGEEERLLTEPNYRSHAHRHFSYFGRSCYAAQLERWFALFPREYFLVLRSEDFFASPDTTLRRTLRFLGLPNEPELYPLPSTAARNVGNSRPFPKALHDQLEALLEPSNAALQRLLGPAFSW
jgi:Sulfotransferase domain